MSKIRFYTDEHVAKAIIRGLRQRGVDVLTVPEANMLGASDEDHLAKAREENRVIFTAWQEAPDIASLKESLDQTTHERIDYLATKSIPPNQIERKLADCINQLHKYHLRNLKEKRAESMELDEQDIKDNEQLREIFAQERHIRSGQKEAAR